MTDEEKKAWEDVVVDARGKLERRAKQGLPHMWESVRDESILAADAELKRLREVVEWVGSLDGFIYQKDHNFGEFSIELRRRAKEGK